MLRFRFFIMLVSLAVFLAAGIIIPGYFKMREFEHQKALQLLSRSVASQTAEIQRSAGILRRTGVLELESYVTAAQNRVIETIQAHTPIEDIHLIVLNENGDNILENPKPGIQVSDLDEWVVERVGENSQAIEKSEKLIVTLTKALEHKASISPNILGLSDKTVWHIAVDNQNEWGWTLYSLMSEDNVFFESRSYLKFVIFISASVLILVLLIYSILTANIRSKIKLVMQHLERYKNGDYSRRMSVTANDEIGKLQANLNSMIDSIESEIDARKTTETQLASAKKESDRANQAKSHFLASMSHEIRNPLTAIIGFSNILKEDKLAPEQSVYVNNILNASNNLRTTLNEILDLTKIERGKIEINISPFNLKQSIEEAFELYALQGEQKGLDMKLVFVSDLTFNAGGDSTRCSQVISNLVHNAIKFTHDGTVCLTIDHEDTGNQMFNLIIECKDTGVGMDQVTSQRVFEAFVQGEDSSSDNKDGIGLGLSIVKGILDSMNGSVQYHPNEPNGSIFKATIPLIKIESMDDTNSNNQPESTFLDSNPRILVAEDDILNRAYISELLKNTGINFDTAEDGIEATEKLENNTFDLILMDIRMPRLGGEEAISRIRQTLTSPKNRTPIIALTANAYDSDIERYIEMGADSCISKPFDPSQLIKEIKLVLEQSQT